jgi:hypothetical protein
MVRRGGCYWNVIRSSFSGSDGDLR